MILPGKHLRTHRSLIGVGQQILLCLDFPRSTSELWENVRAQPSFKSTPLAYDWYLLALSLLFAMDAIELDGGVLRRRDAA